MSAFWIGLDIGGTRIKGGLLDDGGQVVQHDSEATHPRQSLDKFEQQLNTLIAKLKKAAGGKIAGIGLSMTGPIDPEIGCVYLPGKIKGLDQHKTVPYLREQWKVPVTADNDGRLACFAEWKAGAGRGVDNLVVITLGTGIGSGVVLNGRLLGEKNFALGLQCGHFIIRTGGPPRCLTGPHGTGESLCSITALMNSVHDHLTRGLPSTLADVPSEKLDFIALVKAVREKDALAVELFQHWMDLFGTVLLNTYYAYAPDLILLAGGPMKAADLFIDGLRNRLETQAFRVPPHRPIRLEAAQLDEDAGWMGAALMAQEKFGAKP